MQVLESLDEACLEVERFDLHLVSVAVVDLSEPESLLWVLLVDLLNGKGAENVEIVLLCKTQIVGLLMGCIDQLDASARVHDEKF